MEAHNPPEQEPVAAGLSIAQREHIRLTVQAPASTMPGRRPFRLPVSLTNSCSETLSSDYPYRLNVAYHWVDANGGYAPFDGVRTALPRPLDQGDTCEFEMTVRPPLEPGNYTLQVGLVQEQVSWFEADLPDHLQTFPVEVLEPAKPSLRGFKKIPRYAQDRPIEVEAPPAIFSFELTNRCPFKCIMCPRTNNMTRAEGLMSFDTFKKAIDEFVEVNPGYALSREVWLHGFGESLVHPEFARFMRYALDQGFVDCLSINPLMLTTRVRRQLLDAEPAHLYVALDGHDDESFEKIRGVPEAYEKSRRRLLKFLDEKAQRGVKTRITLAMIDFPNNKQSIEEVTAFWSKQVGIDEFVCKPFVSWDGKAEDVNLLMPGAVKQHEPTEKVVCDFPWEKMTVSWDGELVPCCFDYNKKYTLGNINEQSLVEIWNGERMHALRREMKSNKVTNQLCQGCEYLYQETPDV